MRYSHLIGKTKKEAPKDEATKSAQLLIKAGFIYKELAGVYAFLPLGYRVLQKMIQVIREEMDKIGGQEFIMGALQSKELWETSHRWSDEVIDVWFKTKLHNNTELGLATTHEEPFTKIMTSYVESYRDLPMYGYQFQNKFRNELRPSGGILRTREFIMKDLYSFDKTYEGLDIFYEKAKEAYVKIFDRFGIGKQTFLTFASGGPFSKYSHEFQTLCEAGEDTIFLDEKSKIGINKEVLSDEVLSDLKLKKENLKEVRACEVGNIFKLGTRFSEPLKLYYTDEKGEKKPVIMGSYGIAPSRSMGVIAEVLSDKKGLVWPDEIAPYKIHLVGINLENKDVNKKANEIYNELINKKIETLFDDRQDVSAGEKFSDADLIGCPYRVVISAKTGDKVEIKKRTEETSKLVNAEELLKL